MNERIKAVRETLKDVNGRKYSQARFADEMHVTRDMIATYEVGRVEPSPLFINTLCEKYNVDEHWLRTGEGEMFKPKDRNSEIATIAADLYLAPDDDPKTQLIKIVHDMSQEEIEVFVQLARKFAQVYKKDLPDD